MLKTQSMGGVYYSRMVAESPIFYGWIVMLAATFGMIMSSPGQTYAVSIFIDYFIVDLAISRSMVSTLYTIGTLVGSFTLPFVGRQIDRRGARVTVVIISLLFGLAIIYMGFVSSVIMLGLGFAAIRMLGQGSLSLVCQNVINEWWVRRRGFVLGISGVVVSLLALGVFPSLINSLISLYGWRMTYIILGIALLVLMVPVGAIFFRDRPEDYGLQPDGDGASLNEDGSERAKFPEDNWTLAEAMHTTTFWVLIASFVSFSMLGTGLFFHMVSIFEDSGLSATVAAAVFLPIAITTAVVNFAGGILVDRIPLRILLASAMFFQAGCLILAQYLSSLEAAILYGILLGVVAGLTRVLMGVSWANYYGRRYLGSITGVTSTILIAGSALGPMPFGIARDMLGSYSAVLTISALYPLLMGFISLFVSKPQRRTAVEQDA